MISICCTPEKPDYQELTLGERKVFCKMVYLLRKRGYPVLDAQVVACQKVLESCIPFKMDT